MTVPDLERPGRMALAGGTLGLGALSLIFGKLNPGLQPPLELLGDGRLLAYGAGGVLAIAGLSLLGPSRLVRNGGLVLGVFWLAWIVLGHGWKVRADLTDVAAWVSLTEAAGMAIAAWLLSRSSEAPPRQGTQWTARMVVGLMLVWFGAVHLIYRGAIAGMIPAWMPAQDLWPWVTGAANIAAGLGLFTGVLGRLAGALAGLMFASWIALVHVPNLIAKPGDQAEWTALALNLALIGVVWLTGSLAFRRPA